jgi:hypothetical protein
MGLSGIADRLVASPFGHPFQQSIQSRLEALANAE